MSQSRSKLFPGCTCKQKARVPFFTRKLTHKAYWIQLKRLRRRSAEKTKGTLSFSLLLIKLHQPRNKALSKAREMKRRAHEVRGLGEQQTHTGAYFACSVSLSPLFSGITASIFILFSHYPPVHTAMSTEVYSLKPPFLLRCRLRKAKCILYIDMYVVRLALTDTDFYTYSIWKYKNSFFFLN